MPDTCPRCGQPAGEHDCKPDAVWDLAFECCEAIADVVLHMGSIKSQHETAIIARHMRRLMTESPVVTRAREVVAWLEKVKYEIGESWEDTLDPEMIEIIDALRDALPEKTDG